MLEKGMYDSWKTRIWIYIKGKENGEMLIDSIINRSFQLKKEITIPSVTGDADEKLHIYTLINHFQTTKEIWDRVKELMEGTELTLQERESKLHYEFDKFTSETGEKIHSYYWRYAKLINDINISGMTMKQIQVNTKFVNHLDVRSSLDFYTKFYNSIDREPNRFSSSISKTQGVVIIHSRNRLGRLDHGLTEF
nr:hypothetical protein [Tanacetum cinerariifolium]